MILLILIVKWPYRTSLHVEDSFKTNLLPHDKSEVAGGSVPFSTSRKEGNIDRHAICNPMLAERNVQTKRI